MPHLRLNRLFSKLNPERDPASEIYDTRPVSYADQYPHVPKPDGELSPWMILARWASHDLYGEDMPAVAADLLEAGLDTPSLRRLAGETLLRSSADAEGLVTRLFTELGIPYPIGESQALMIYTREIARQVIAGLRNPWSAANYLEIAVWGWNGITEDLRALFAINDEMGWGVSHRRPVAVLTSALIDIVARLAALSDEEIRRL